MAGKLAQEIRQTKPFSMVEEEAVLNIARTADTISRHMTDFLKEYNLSPTQYNLLRILRGAGKDGITCSQLGDRLITRDPDVTRLLDRLESRSLVSRERSNEDRRIVVTQISEQGLELVNRIDSPVRASLKSSIGKIGKAELASLIDTLEKVREIYE